MRSAGRRRRWAIKMERLSGCVPATAFAYTPDTPYTPYTPYTHTHTHTHTHAPTRTDRPDVTHTHKK